MFIVTNRKIEGRGRKDARGFDRIGAGVNPSGPRELRLLEATRSRAGDWRLGVLGDQLTVSQLKRLNTLRATRLDHVAEQIQAATDEVLSDLNSLGHGGTSEGAGSRIATGTTASITRAVASATEVLMIERDTIASLRAADRPVPHSELVCELIYQRLLRGRHFMFFVHGYNVNLEAAVDGAGALGQAYDVEPVVFSWPSRGGGGLERLAGTASYLRDKEVARLSASALSRCLHRIGGILEGYRTTVRPLLEGIAAAIAPDHAEARASILVALERRVCPVRLSMLVHSMGAYLVEKMVESASLGLSRTVFDNILLVAPDANDAKHRHWVEDLPARNRVYIVVNEDDYALAVSRAKWGEEQKARLGQVANRQQADMARNAVYVDLTGADGVGSTHAPFDPSIENPHIASFFGQALRGERAERGLRYDVSAGVHRPVPIVDRD